MIVIKLSTYLNGIYLICDLFEVTYKQICNCNKRLSALMNAGLLHLREPICNYMKINEKRVVLDTNVLMDWVFANVR